MLDPDIAAEMVKVGTCHKHMGKHNATFSNKPGADRTYLKNEREDGRDMKIEA